MSIVRNAKRHHYVAIDNATVEDQRLSWAARGLLTYLLSKPPEWQVNVSQLIKAGPIGRDGIYALLRELTGFGYARAIPKREAGKFAGYDWEIHERPDTALPDTANPDTVTIEKDQAKTTGYTVSGPAVSGDTVSGSTVSGSTVSGKSGRIVKRISSKTDLSKQPKDFCAALDASAAPAPVDSRVETKKVNGANRPTGPPPDDDSPIVAFMPLNGGGEYRVSERMAARYGALYPGIDVEQQLRSMWAWLEANPRNRKTAGGIKRFINGWLAKEQNRARR